MKKRQYEKTYDAYSYEGHFRYSEAPLGCTRIDICFANYNKGKEVPVLLRKALYSIGFRHFYKNVWEIPEKEGAAMLLDHGSHATFFEYLEKRIVNALSDV